MEVNEIALENSLKKTSLTSNLVSLFIAFLTAMAVGFGFYYKTNATLAYHTETLHNFKQELENTKKDLTEFQFFKGVSQSQVNTLEKKVDRIDAKIDELIMMTKRSK